MRVAHSFATQHADEAETALSYLVNTFTHAGDPFSVKLDLRRYLEVANRRREYPGFPFIRLPQVDVDALKQTHSPFAEVVVRRESVRDYAGTLTQNQLSQILHLSAGIRRKDLNGTVFRHYPSAGGLFPMDIFLCIKDVEGLEPGVYFYDPHEHGLWHIGSRDGAEECFGALTGAQSFVSGMACALLLTADLDKTLWKYGGRGLRYVFLDCGHLAQNLTLSAQACGAGTCGIGGFCENDLHRVLGLAVPDEVVLYALALGVPKASASTTENPAERYL